MAKKNLEQAYEEAKPKIGTGAFQASMRQGWKELGAAFGKAFPDSIQIDEAGTLGNLTPVEVYQTKHPKSHKAVEQEKGHGVHGASKEGPELDMG